MSKALPRQILTKIINRAVDGALKSGDQRWGRQLATHYEKAAARLRNTFGGGTLLGTSTDLVDLAWKVAFAADYPEAHALMALVPEAKAEEIAATVTQLNEEKKQRILRQLEAQDAAS